MLTLRPCLPSSSFTLPIFLMFVQYVRDRHLIFLLIASFPLLQTGPPGMQGPNGGNGLEGETGLTGPQGQDGDQLTLSEYLCLDMCN